MHGLDSISVLCVSKVSDSIVSIDTKIALSTTYFIKPAHSISKDSAVDDREMVSMEVQGLKHRETREGV